MPSQKKPLSSGRWLLLFGGTVFLLAAAVAAFNFCVDPFGAFGDFFLEWWGYDATLNPRVAKISYLDQHHQEYDSYIVGPSSTSSYPTEALNRYFDADFYNLTMYGGDMKDVELTCRYLLDNYTVKNLAVSLYIHSGEVYDTEPDPLTYNLHWKVDGSSPLAFYGKYLFADPRLSLSKLQRHFSDPYLTQSYRVFDPQTGAYDKSSRNVEPIGDLEEYVSRPAYQVFADYPQGESAGLPQLEACMGSLRAIREMCRQAGVTLTVLCPPLYYEHLERYSPEDQAAFRRALAEVTDYWDFTLSSVSYDPRYFYDESHFRDCVGEMCLAKMFGNEEIYCPEDLGEHVLQGSDPGPYTGTRAEEGDYTDSAPVLLYHSLAGEGQGSDTMSTARFAEHMAALKEAGYTAVGFDQLKAYVELGSPLPEKPVVITFDDGYANNYELARPILKEYGMEATVFAIGVSLGKSEYKDTGRSMTPHFSREQAEEMNREGVLLVQSHGYDLHHVEGLDEEPLRKGALQMEGESDEAYVEFLREDCLAMEKALGYRPTVLAYPYGNSSTLSELILSQMGIEITLSTQSHTNTLVKGLPQSLRQLGRYYMKEDISGEDLLELLGE